jgi:peroxygenase
MGSFVEWRAAYSVLKDHEGFVHKEDLLGIYDGTVFYRLEEKVKKVKEGKKGSPSS